jgi:hypothetical protein
MAKTAKCPRSCWRISTCGHVCAPAKSLLVHWSVRAAISFSSWDAQTDDVRTNSGKQPPPIRQFRHRGMPPRRERKDVDSVLGMGSSKNRPATKRHKREALREFQNRKKPTSQGLMARRLASKRRGGDSRPLPLANLLSHNILYATRLPAMI